jgi:putative transposase
MPRTGRVLIPNYPHHIVQRGHNQQVVFAEPSDYHYYLDTLQTWKRHYEIKVNRPGIPGGSFV